MNKPRDKWIEAAAKLIELTQEGNIKWYMDHPPSELRMFPDEKVARVFKTQYKGRNLRLYERFYKDPRMARLSFWSIIGRKEPEWESEVVLEFVDDKDRAFGFFPPVNPLNDLFSTVKYQVSDIDDFIDELLKQE